MPFTFSHPAAVLPIHSRFKKWIPLSALVIGSLVPDAAYYLPMPEHFKQNSHTLLGTFSSSLPVGIFFWLIFYWLAAPAVFLLPSPHRDALQSKLKPAQVSIQQALVVALGIVFGAWSHVLWDSCTHAKGWVVRQTPLLRDPLFGNAILGYQVVQYLSTILGLCVLLYAYDKWMKASGFRLWTWRGFCWRCHLWLGVVVTCLVAAIIESHTIHAIASASFLYNRHFGFVFLTGFARDMLIALCTVSIGAKMLGLCSSHEPYLKTPP